MMAREGAVVTLLVTISDLNGDNHKSNTKL
jgi:hypothetical protein